MQSLQERSYLLRTHFDWVRHQDRSRKDFRSSVLAHTYQNKRCRSIYGICKDYRKFVKGFPTVQIIRERFKICLDPRLPRSLWYTEDLIDCLFVSTSPVHLYDDIRAFQFSLFFSDTLLWRHGKVWMTPEMGASWGRSLAPARQLPTKGVKQPPVSHKNLIKSTN